MVNWPVYVLFWSNKSREVPAGDSAIDIQKTISVSLRIAGIGSILKLFSFIDHNNDGIFWVYSIGQLLIAIATIVHF